MCAGSSGSPIYSSAVAFSPLPTIVLRRGARVGAWLHAKLARGVVDAQVVVPITLHCSQNFGPEMEM